MQKSSGFMAVVLVASVAGCSSSKQSASSYPAPIFDTVPIARRRPAPLPRPPVAPPPRITPAPAPPSYMSYAEPGWIPPHGIVNRWAYIVLHHSATRSGGAKSFDRHHRLDNDWDELGYHFVIGNGTETADGQVEVGPRWTKQKHGAHCKTPSNYYNQHGIGICLVGDFSDSSPSPAQLASLNRLLTFLTEACGIPTDHIVSHGGVTHKTACPGRNFPLAQVRNRVAQSQTRYVGRPAPQRQLSRL